AKVDDPYLSKVALMAGSGMLGASTAETLKKADPVNNSFAPTFSLNRFDAAYVNLEYDIARGADQHTIKADAYHLAALAQSNHDDALFNVASGISSSIPDDGSISQTFDPTKSLTDLMNNPPVDPQQAELDAFNKLLDDLKNGRDQGTIQQDAQDLAG